MSVPETVRMRTVIGLALGLAATAAQARDRTPPTTATNPVIVASSSTSVTLAWTRSTDNSSGFGDARTWRVPSPRPCVCFNASVHRGFLPGRAADYIADCFTRAQWSEACANLF